MTDEREERIGAAVRQWRIDAGLSQDKLADRASLSRTAIQRLETGAGTRLASLIRALRALGREEALDPLTPRSGPSPLERLSAERRAARATARRVRRRD